MSEVPWPQVSTTAEVLWMNLVLSGDSAVIHATLLGGLPASRRPTALVLATLGATGARLLALGPMLVLLAFPGVALVGAAVLVVVGARLLARRPEPSPAPPGETSLARTVGVLVSADVLMGMDNAIAVAAVSGGQVGPLAVGLVVSIAIAMGCGGLFAQLAGRASAWVGASLIAWSAGRMVVTELVRLGAVDGPAGQGMVYAVVAVLVVLGSLWSSE